uniref:Uncharacterized protein n=1 Tax=Anopheles melas TaxID=34690 RepID=A0A182TJB2_9DIPT
MDDLNSRRSSAGLEANRRTSPSSDAGLTFDNWKSRLNEYSCIQMGFRFGFWFASVRLKYHDSNLQQRIVHPLELGLQIRRIVQNPPVERVRIVVVHADDTEARPDQHRVKASLSDRLLGCRWQPGGPLIGRKVVQPFGGELRLRDVAWGEHVCRIVLMIAEHVVDGFAAKHIAEQLVRTGHRNDVACHGRLPYTVVDNVPGVVNVSRVRMLPGGSSHCILYRFPRRVTVSVVTPLAGPVGWVGRYALAFATAAGLTAHRIIPSAIVWIVVHVRDVDDLQVTGSAIR